MQHDPIGQFGQLAIMAVTGAFAGLARILSLYEIKFTKRRAFANIIGSAVVAIIAGGLYVFVFPGNEGNILIIAAIASAAGALGFPYLVEKLRGEVEERITKGELNLPDTASNKAVHQLADEVEFSHTTRTLIDSGEFSQEEIQQMIETARKRKERIAERLEASK